MFSGVPGPAVSNVVGRTVKTPESAHLQHSAHAGGGDRGGIGGAGVVRLTGRVGARSVITTHGCLGDGGSVGGAGVVCLTGRVGAAQHHYNINTAKHSLHCDGSTTVLVVLSEYPVH